MRKIHIMAEEFDDFLYAAVITGPAENLQQLETAVRLICKLRDPSYTREEVIPIERQQEAARIGQKLVPGRQMSVESTNLELEEDEYQLCLSKLEQHIHRVNMVGAPELYNLIQKFKLALSFSNNHFINPAKEVA
jgi:hypothetical protein